MSAAFGRLAAQLAVLQLGLVHLLCVTVGLAVYGSEFGTAPGRVILVAVPLAVLLGFLPRSPLAALARTRLAPVVALVGVGAAAWTYKPLHMRSWDERSLDLAIAVGVLGLFSAFAAAAGVARVGASTDRRGLAPALAVVASVWWAVAFTGQAMVPFLGLAVGFAALVAAPPAAAPSARRATPRAWPAGWTLYAALLVGLDLTLPVWDHQTVPAWAPHLAVAFAAAALVAALPARHASSTGRASLIGWALAALNFALAALWPEWALTIAHGVVAGGALGALLVGALTSGRSVQLVPAGFVLGALLAHAVTQQLAFSSLRVLLLLPLVWLLARGRRSATAAR